METQDRRAILAAKLQAGAELFYIITIVGGIIGSPAVALVAGLGSLACTLGKLGLFLRAIRHKQLLEETSEGDLCEHDS